DDLLQIPLSPAAKQILQKHQGKGLKALPVISNQKTNDHLKDLCRLAGITDIVSQSRKSGGATMQAMVQKCDLITTHAARRTFVTLSLESGIRTEIVMAITGHKDYATMKKYIKITE